MSENLHVDDYNCKELRKKIFLTAYSGVTAHLASAFSCVEIIYTLYIKKILRYDIHNPKWPNRDYLILSKGHGSLALYTVLNAVGFISDTELRSFEKPTSILGGEPHCLDIPGVEASTGSLGHGLSIGVGIALAKILDKSDSIVYVILGDGECQEGSVWEAVMSAAKYKLRNLVVILDNNKIQKMGLISDIMGIDSWKDKWMAFGWDAVSVNGHDVAALYSILSTPRKSEKPLVVIADTIKGKGVSIMENNPSWHFKLPNKKELKIFMNELNISQEEVDLCKKHT